MVLCVWNLHLLLIWLLGEVPSVAHALSYPGNDFYYDDVFAGGVDLETHLTSDIMKGEIHLSKATYLEGDGLLDVIGSFSRFNTFSNIGISARCESRRESYRRRDGTTRELPSEVSVSVSIEMRS